MHGISSISSELGQNLPSKNNVMPVVEGTGQEDCFSRRTLRVVLNTPLVPPHLSCTCVKFCPLAQDLPFLSATGCLV